jgi:hypothetical protein
MIELYESPDKYTNSENDVERGKDLFLLMDLASSKDVHEQIW